ncbi:hypothetical protein Vi05172_g6755 [Venturia inaequalis]|nr:hypothetical protein Vi05172_g6755 [Venturia inaequalis]
MPLVRLKPTDNGKQWGDIAEASYLKAYFNDSKVEITGLVTVLKRDHHAVIVQKGCDIIIAFLENGEAEWNRNGWYLGKSAPYKRKVDGDLVHSYYLAVWEGMREHARADLTHAIGKILQEGKTVRKILVCGHSLGGGVSSPPSSESSQGYSHQRNKHSRTLSECIGSRSVLRLTSGIIVPKRWGHGVGITGWKSGDVESPTERQRKSMGRA